MSGRGTGGVATRGAARNAQNVAAGRGAAGGGAAADPDAVQQNDNNLANQIQQLLGMVTTLVNNNNQLTNNLNAAHAALNAAAANHAGGGNPAPLILNLHEGGNPYDLGTRAGIAAYKEACTPLDFKFDGSHDTYPNFITALKQRVSQCCWDDQVSGISDVAGRNLFNEIHLLSMAEIEAARNNRVNPRARQNADAFYQVLIHSIDGDLHTNFLGQGRLPSHKDGPLLFKAIQDFTTVNTMDAGTDTNKELLLFDPEKYKFNIVTINHTLNMLFIRATHSPLSNQVGDRFKLHYTLEAYSKIKRPTEWATFVCDAKRQASARPPRLTDPTTLMNEGVEMYRTLKQFTGEYMPNSRTLEEEVVAMKAIQERQDKRLRKPAPKGEPEPKKQKADEDPPHNSNLPKWVNHTHRPKHQGGKPYQMDDTRVFNGKTYYFHDQPIHRDGRRWYTHKSSRCQACERHRGRNDEEKKEDDDQGNRNGRKARLQANLGDTTEGGTEDLTKNKGGEELSIQAHVARAYDQAEASEHREAIQAHLGELLRSLQNGDFT